MLIRKAKAEDAKFIADYIMLSMEDIVYKFIGEDSYQKAIDFLNSLIKEKGNQCEIDGRLIKQQQLVTFNTFKSKH